MAWQWNELIDRTGAVLPTLEEYGDNLFLQFALDSACGSEQEQNSPRCCSVAQGIFWVISRGIS